MSPETVHQYQLEERSLIAYRIRNDEIRWDWGNSLKHLLYKLHSEARDPIRDWILELERINPEEKTWIEDWGESRN